MEESNKYKIRYRILLILNSTIMKKKVIVYSLSLSFLFIIGTVFSTSVSAQTKPEEVTIQELSSNYIQFQDEAVVVKGLVTQYQPETVATMAYYSIEGEYGYTATVKTSKKPPKLQRKYKVRAVVKLDDAVYDFYLIEINKRIILPVWVIVLIAVIALLVAGIGYLLISSFTSKPEEAPAKPAPASAAEPAYDDAFKTVQIVTDKDAKKTLVYIPGKLSILTGEDKGKDIILSGYPGPDGAIVTIGSREEQGERKTAHIRLMEPTVSRAQAELVLLNKDKKLMIKNLSKTNYTQVNGEEVLPDTLKEVVAGDTIKTGEVEFKYEN